MTTALAIVSASLRKIRVIDMDGIPSNKELQYGIDALNRMLARWKANGLLPDWASVSTGSDVVGFSAEDEDCVIAQLAQRLASEFGVKVPQDFVQVAQQLLASLWRDRLVPSDTASITAGSIIYRALRNISGKGAAYFPDDISMQGALQALNAMITRWQASGTQLGFSPVSAVSDAMNTPAEADNAIVYNLAMELADEYGLDPSRNLAEKAFKGLQAISADQAVATPLRARGSGLPRSEGIYGSRYNIYSDSHF